MISKHRIICIFFSTSKLSRYRRQHHLLRTKSIAEEDTEEIRKIKKVQSLCRGWLYRQRWKRIVDEYIR